MTLPGTPLHDLDTLDLRELVDPAVEEGGPVRLRVAALEDGALRRAGAAYDVTALRRAVAALAGRGGEVHVSAPAADAATSPDALVETLREAARLALRFPDRVTVELTAPPAPPTDPWTATGIDVARAEGADLGVARLGAVREAWRARHAALPEGEERDRGETLLRRVDDAGRRVVFELLRQAWLGREEGGLAPPDRAAMLATAERVLGERGTWMKGFRQFTYDMVRRLVVIPTWQCELRCAYCFIPKQDGRVMPERTYERSVELLLSTEQPEVLLQFFGGEALLEWPRVRHAILYAERRAAEVGKRISFLLSSNGWSLDEEKLAFFAAHRVGLELSIDGDARTQDRFRASRSRDASSYANSIARLGGVIPRSGVDHLVIMVVHPTNVDAMPANFFHIADLGFELIQINPMLGRLWTPEQLAAFAKGLHQIGLELQRRRAAGSNLELENLRHKAMPVRLNGEVTVDWDGTIYGGNAFLHETEHKDKFVLAHLDDATGVDRYWVDATDNNFLLDWSYRPAVTRNNLEVGKVMASFLRWLRERQGEVTAPSGQGSDRPARAP